MGHRSSWQEDEEGWATSRGERGGVTGRRIRIGIRRIISLRPLSGGDALGHFSMRRNSYRQAYLEQRKSSSLSS